MNNRNKTEILALTEDLAHACGVPEGYDRVIMLDTTLPGFGVVKTQAGEMTYFVCFKTYRNEWSRWRLGNAGEISIQTARERATLLLKQVQMCRGCPAVDSCGEFLPAEEENTVYLPIPSCTSFTP